MTDKPPSPDFSPAAIAQAAQIARFEELAHRAGLNLEADTWTEFVASTVDLHRAGQIDLLATAVAGEGRIGYFVGRLYGEAFVELDVTVTAMLDLAMALMARQGDGNLPGFIYDSFANWAAKAPDRADEALAAIRAGGGLGSLLIATLNAGLRAARARFLPIVVSMMRDGNDEESVAAGFVLGTVETAEDAERRLVHDALAEVLAGSEDARRLAAFGAALAIGTRDGGEEAVALAAIDTVERNSSPQLRKAAATALFLADGRPSEGLVARFCDLLRATETGEGIEEIDNAIAQHMSGPTAGPRLALLADLLRRDVTDLAAMDGVTHNILADKDDLLRTLVTDWIAEGSEQMIGAVHDLVAQPVLGEPLTIDLDFTRHALSLDRTLSVARRIVASLVLYPQATASILLSLMRTGHGEAVPELEELLFDPLLISYWDGPRRYLDQVAANQPQAVREAITRVTARLDEYVAAIRGAGTIREFGPSERQRFLRHILKAEAQREIHKSARKMSVFADLFATKVVLYGDSVISDVYRGNGDKPERHEFRMGTVEHTMEVARLDAIDPVGFWYQRIVLSMGKAQ